ncbi:MAG: SNF2-related protein [Candidatus Bipolaricaulota bacterium]|nr:SNF2-related protein [Candidatus Bipolaricaulota bacterium]
MRILQAEVRGELLRLVAVGAKSQRYYGECWLRPEEQEKLTPVLPAGPTFSGQAEALFLGVEAHRIRLAHQFDPLHALHVSLIDPLPHQIDAVYFHMLPQARLRFLLADDPGAGKTIMAGLLLKELKYRGLVERVLLVVPGHLRDQWLRELREKFGESFLAVDRGLLRSAYGQNPWREFPQVLTSMDFAKQDDVLQTLADVEWDLVIVDEAHKLAAYRYGEQTKKTQRYRLGEALARNARMLLFLTATPHRGDPENFRLLLALLDPDLFATAEVVEEAVRRGENPLVLRRLKEDLKTIEGIPLFPPRRVHTVVFRLSPEEREFYWALTRYVRDAYNRALDEDRRNVQFALLLLQRRLASSLYAARKSLERRRDRLQRLLEKGELLRERGEVDEEELEDLPEAERWEQEEELLAKLTAARTLEDLRAEIATLDDLIRRGRELERAGVETKVNELRQLLANLAQRHPNEKLVVFTESRDTLEYLAAQLRRWGFSVTTLHGGMNLEERIRAEAEFRERTQILVSTEAGGEGARPPPGPKPARGVPPAPAGGGVGHGHFPLLVLGCAEARAGRQRRPPAPGRPHPRDPRGRRGRHPGKARGLPPLPAPPRPPLLLLHRAIAEAEEVVEEAAIREEIRKVVEKRVGTESPILEREVWPSLPEKVAERQDRHVLVVLAPELPHGSEKTEEFVNTLFAQAGSGYRVFPGALLVLAPDREEFLALRQRVRRLLALREVQRTRASELSEEDKERLVKDLRYAENDVVDLVPRVWRHLALWGGARGVEWIPLAPYARAGLTLASLVVEHLRSANRLSETLAPEVLLRYVPLQEGRAYREVWEGFLRNPGMPIVAERAVREAVLKGVKAGLFGLRVDDKVYFGREVPAAHLDEAELIPAELAASLVGKREEAIAKPPAPPPAPGPEKGSPPKPQIRRKYQLVVKVPSDRLSDFVRGVILPLQRATDEVELEIHVRAKREEGIPEDVVEHKVRETLRQLPVEVREDRLE